MIAPCAIKNRPIEQRKDAMLVKPDTTTAHASDGSEREIHRAIAMLGDWHAEYTGAWPKRYGGWPEDWASVKGIDIFLLQEVHDALSGHELDEALLNQLLPGFEDDDEIGQYSTVWVIEGTVAGHEMAFNELLGWLDVQPGGDDDFFDYWPNTMDMLWQYAQDLDEWETRIRAFDDDVKIVSRQLKVKRLASKVWSNASDNRVEWEYRAWLTEKTPDNEKKGIRLG